MDNFFLTQLFDWGWRGNGWWLELGNRLLSKAGTSWTLCRLTTPYTHTTTIEQRINLWHLAGQPLAAGVPGELVELGCFDGKTAVIFARVIAQFAPERTLHLYDHFQVGFHLAQANIEELVLANFQTAGSAPPRIHRGDFLETIPKELPTTIAFAHFDCGGAHEPARHADTLHHLLTHVYPRMPRGAIGVLMDYYDPAVCRGRDVNPAVAPTVQAFFAEKSEQVVSLWGGDYAHAFFRKA